MFTGIDLMLGDIEDPLEGHPRYEKIRIADCMKSNVQIALDRKSGRNVAIKFFPRGPSITDAVRREILHHAELHHVNVVALNHVFLTSSYLCISLELGSQNLWQYVHSRGGCLPEEEAQSIFVQLIDGVHYCHAQGVANRDIKLENCLVNLLYHQGMPYNIVKICDFGYCKNVEKDSLPDSLVGTAAYLSLDILKHPKGTGYDAKLVDIWSCGVLLYYLLEGRFPFGTEVSNGGRAALWGRIEALDYEMGERLSYGAQDLLSQIFCLPEFRIDMEGIRDHWWVRQAYRKDHIKHLHRLQEQSSSSQVNRQSSQEMEQLIREAVTAPPQTHDDLDVYLP